ncbi:MAG: GTP-binding protein, partial [Gemmataceae bacterium]|nr:GTP-binding protein [Gemmataceae bacterium]
MSKVLTQDIRNIALAGHRASGKTTLADALLFQAKAVERKGGPDDGTSVSDFDEEEKHHRFSIDSAVLHLDHAGKHLNLIDTPGAPDFVGNALVALAAVETVVVAVSAVNGVEVNTRRMFNEAKKRGLARMIVINKIDHENARFSDVYAAIRETFGKECVLFNAPVGSGPSCSAIVDLVHPPATAPAGLAVDLAAARSQMLDSVVECDDALMEKYLDDPASITDKELVHAIHHALDLGCVVPVFCVAAKKGLGVKELLDALAEDALGADETHPRKAARQGAEVEVKPDPAGEFVGVVFKAVSDKFVGNLSYIRVLQGTYKTDQPIVNARTEKGSRTGGLLRVQGSKTTPLAEAVAGDIVAVSKVEDLHIGDTVGSAAHPPRLEEPAFPRPLFGLAVQPKARGDEQKISTSLAKIAAEDPTFKVSRDAQTHEMVITGMSQLHLDVMRERLKRRFALEVLTHEPKVPYRETVSATAEGMHKHKKQTGGRGQFGEVHLRVYP